MALGKYLRWNGTEYECGLCDRTFSSQQALFDHCKHSFRHLFCAPCKRVFRGLRSYTTHLEYSNAHPDIVGYDAALAEASRHRCDNCTRCFADANQLRMHQQRHHPANMECYGCSNMFKSFSGMLIHLEAGCCDSGADFDSINDLALECYQSRKYAITDKDWNLESYYCRSCGDEFTKLSGLFQHAEKGLTCTHLNVPPEFLAKLRLWIRKTLREVKAERR